MSQPDDLQDPFRNQTRAISRRDFFRRLGAGLALTVLPKIDIQEVLAPDASANLAGWSASMFASQLGKPFTVNLGSAGHVVLTLTKVKDGVLKIHHGPQKAMTSAPAGTSFVLVLSGPAKPVLAPKTYVFQQAQLGKFSLFISPSGTDSNGRKYIAVINHVHP